MEKFREMVEAKSSVRHGKYTITYTEGEDGTYFFVTQGKDFIGSIDLSIGQEGIKEDIRELTRSSDDTIVSNRDLQKLIGKYAR